MRIALVGDLIVSRPLAERAAAAPGFAQTMTLLREADVTFGNLETAICSLDAPGVVAWGVREDWVVRADPAVAADLGLLGFDLLGRGNNHSMDWGLGGLRETSRLLDEAGLAHAGTGASRTEAFAPAWVDRSGARIALVSATTSYADHSPALDPFGDVQARPGVAALRVRATISAPEGDLEAIRRLAAAYPEAETAWAPQPGDPMELFRRRFVTGDEAWSVSYEVDDSDRSTLLGSIERASQEADVVLLALHVHQGDHDPAHPPPFLRELAGAAVEAGANAVVVSGPHRLAPVEVIDGRPVFYGLGNFVWSDVQDPLPGYYFDEARELIKRRFAAGDAAAVSDADLIEALNEGVFDDPDVYRAVIAELEIEGDKTQIRLVPVELGFGRPLVDGGVPALVVGEIADVVLERMRSISSALGADVGADGTVEG